MSTDYHAKYCAHDLTRRCASDSVEKLTAVLSDAQVDLKTSSAFMISFRNISSGQRFMRCLRVNARS